LGISTIFEYLKLYLQSLKTTKSCKQDGENLFKILKHSIAMVRIHTFILSNFNFCPLACHFCNKSNTSKLEKIQARALRFIYEDYESTYDELLEKAKVPSLKVRRMRTMAIECFKILSKLSPSCLHDLVVFQDCKNNFRYSNIVDIPRVRTSTKTKVNLFNFERKQPMRFKTFNC
jgi:hypothetical protein